MTLQQLRYIIEIAQSGSISLAAQRLFITQPSLSKSVADLEKEMGITIPGRGQIPGLCPAGGGTGRPAGTAV